MKRNTRLTNRQEQEEQQVAGQQEKVSSAPLEFSTPEELLRHDALHTPVPPSLGRRLQASADQLPPPAPPAKSWWRRFIK